VADTRTSRREGEITDNLHGYRQREDEKKANALTPRRKDRGRVQSLSRRAEKIGNSLTVTVNAERKEGPPRPAETSSWRRTEAALLICAIGKREKAEGVTSAI